MRASFLRRACGRAAILSWSDFADVLLSSVILSWALSLLEVCLEHRSSLPVLRLQIDLQFDVVHMKQYRIVCSNRLIDFSKYRLPHSHMLKQLTSRN
jgi:hypothetical protein